MKCENCVLSHKECKEYGREYISSNCIDIDITRKHPDKPECQVMIVHTPVRKEVASVEDLRKVESQRNYLIDLLEGIYESRGESDKLNCKVVRIKSQLALIYEHGNQR